MSTTINRLRPVQLKIIERYSLTKANSSKQTYHIVLSTQDSGLSFKVGDSLGIYAENDPQLVDRLIQALRQSPHTPVIAPRSQELVSLRDFLQKKANLARISDGLLQMVEASTDYPKDNDILDVLLDHPSCTIDLQTFVANCAPLLPRFYSIASSPLAHPEELHLTVALSSHEHRGEKRYGVASHYLCNLAQLYTTPILAYIQSTAHFILPEDDTHLIMIGPGTGVAPFRAFLQERTARSAPGKNWLFFGERQQACDFFYESFFTSLVRQKQLKLDLAFSRDQEEKIYVQHRLLEQGAEIWRWLQEGAIIYVCGDADPMAKDVEASLQAVINTHGNLSEEEQRNYIKKLRQAKRYRADVY